MQTALFKVSEIRNEYFVSTYIDLRLSYKYEDYALNELKRGNKGNDLCSCKTPGCRTWIHSETFVQ